MPVPGGKACCFGDHRRPKDHRGGDSSALDLPVRSVATLRRPSAVSDHQEGRLDQPRGSGAIRARLWSRMYIADRRDMITVRAYVSSVCRDRPQGTSGSGALRTRSAMTGDGAPRHLPWSGRWGRASGRERRSTGRVKGSARRACSTKPYGRTGKTRVAPLDRISIQVNKKRAS